MVRVQYKGYRIWAIFQTNGKYRAWFYDSPLGIMADVTRVIEGDTESRAIKKAIQFLDDRPEQCRPQRYIGEVLALTQDGADSFL
jgi:hypothetical protein